MEGDVRLERDVMAGHGGSRRVGRTAIGEGSGGVDSMTRDCTGLWLLLICAWIVSLSDCGGGVYLYSLCRCRSDEEREEGQNGDERVGTRLEKQ